MKTNFRELAEYWGIPEQTLRSRAKKSPRQFEAFEIGTYCLQQNISLKDIKALKEIKTKVVED